MKRREFITAATLMGFGLGLESFVDNRKTHILTLSFDDGFKKSFYKVAEIHKEYGLSACLNVIAMGHIPGFVNDKFIPQDILGDFNDWNKIKSMGHEIMPHSWDHKNLTELSQIEAKENLDKCFDYFEKNLDGYDAKNAVYNFAYNASNQDLDEYALKRVRAIRAGGWLVLNKTKYNPIPNNSHQLKLGCWGQGPNNCDAYIDAEINEFLAGSGGWLILNVHGLDNEGWGPLSTVYLDNLYKRLSKITYLDILPIGKVLTEK
jgi:peptidoglycan/xylan/chitin deacetylase (PgdA/CDA1 family)